jgi:hypothetical protein
MLGRIVWFGMRLVIYAWILMAVSWVNADSSPTG